MIITGEMAQKVSDTHVLAGTLLTEGLSRVEAITKLAEQLKHTPHDQLAILYAATVVIRMSGILREKEDQ